MVRIHEICYSATLINDIALLFLASPAPCAGAQTPLIALDMNSLDASTDGAAGAGCADTCRFASDGNCDDGGAGSEFYECSLSSDCTDCGAPPSAWAASQVMSAGWGRTQETSSTLSATRLREVRDKGYGYYGARHWVYLPTP
eukprot:32991-Prymnesium_polylepis.1